MQTKQMTKDCTGTLLGSIPSDLNLVKEILYDRCDFHFTDLEINRESREYGACSFKLNGKKVYHRTSKITPTKTGQFVTIWKRNEEGITTPFDTNDCLDFLVITAKNEENLGQFIFPKSVLAEKGIITRDGKAGKRGIRVYPPWDIPGNKQAEKTQKWQMEYFVDIKKQHSADLELAKKLFSSTNLE